MMSSYCLIMAKEKSWENARRVAVNDRLGRGVDLSAVAEKVKRLSWVELRVSRADKNASISGDCSTDNPL